MSIHAIAWVFDQIIRPATLKFVLVAMADCANEKDEMKCWPSVKHVCEVTSLERKTVLASIAQLVQLGWLVDTGERRGKTMQVKVYRLCLPKNNSTENGTVKESRISNQRVPKTDIEESQKRDTEPLLEPLLNQASEVAAVKNGDKKENPEKDPTSCVDEVLPYEWCSYAESRGIPYDQIYRSWGRFKGSSEAPWTRDGWHRWVDREKFASRTSDDRGAHRHED